MNRVWRVTVKYGGKTIASVLYSNEESAQNYADQYRESDFIYHVNVEQVAVHD